MLDKLDPMRAFAAAFAISSLGGLSALLRGGQPLTVRGIAAAMLYSGLVGLIIALLWYEYFDGKGNIYFLLGVSGLAGVGGATVVDFAIQMLSRGGVDIHITPKKPSGEIEQEDD